MTFTFDLCALTDNSGSKSDEEEATSDKQDDVQDENGLYLDSGLERGRLIYLFNNYFKTWKVSKAERSNMIWGTQNLHQHFARSVFVCTLFSEREMYKHSV